MNKKLFLIITLSFAIISCSEKTNFDLEIDNSNKIFEKFDLSLFPKNINGTVVTEIPIDVFQKLLKDLGDKGSILEKYYIRKDSMCILDNECKQKFETELQYSTRNDYERAFTYKSHLEKVGWTEYSFLGQMTGTTGQSKRLEALEFTYTSYTTDFKARAYVEKNGWLPWVGIGETVGTTQQSKRLEAIEINVNSSFATNVYYQVYMEKIGWGPLVGNGETAGTIGEHRRVEAFRLYMYIL